MARDVRVEEVTRATLRAAGDLLIRFFREEGFKTPPEQIVRIARARAEDPTTGSAWRVPRLACSGGRHVGVISVTTALYVEWGRLGEIGDLYVLPERRGRGVAGALIAAAEARCAGLGCSSVSAVAAGLARARHDLRAFYLRRGFIDDGRAVLIRPIV